MPNNPSPAPPTILQSPSIPTYSVSFSPSPRMHLKRTGDFEEVEERHDEDGGDDARETVAQGSHVQLRASVVWW